MSQYGLAGSASRPIAVSRAKIDRNTKVDKSGGTSETRKPTPSPPGRPHRWTRTHCWNNTVIGRISCTTPRGGSNPNRGPSSRARERAKEGKRRPALAMKRIVPRIRRIPQRFAERDPPRDGACTRNWRRRPTGAPPIPADDEMRQYASPPSPASSWSRRGTMNPAPFHSPGCHFQYPLTRAHGGWRPDTTRAAGTGEDEGGRGRRERATRRRQRRGSGDRAVEPPTASQRTNSSRGDENVETAQKFQGKGVPRFLASRLVPRQIGADQREIASDEEPMAAVATLPSSVLLQISPARPRQLDPSLSPSIVEKPSEQCGEGRKCWPEWIVGG